MQSKTVLYFIAILAGSWSADAAEVALRPQSHAQGSLVLLGDVADVKSADAARVEQLKRVELFPAPAQHRTKLMHVRELVELLVLHGVDIDDIEFTGARTTRVYAPTEQSLAAVAGLPASGIEASVDMVVVARRSLNRGDIVRDADIEMQPVDSRTNGFQLAAGREAVVGMEVLSPIRDGQAIAAYQLRKPLLVKRGEIINVCARAAGVRVTTTARAVDEGSLGDVIMVQSLENRASYATHVTGFRQAEVYASGVVAADPARATAARPNLKTETR